MNMTHFIHDIFLPNVKTTQDDFRNRERLPAGVMDSVENIQQLFAEKTVQAEFYHSMQQLGTPNSETYQLVSRLRDRVEYDRSACEQVETVMTQKRRGECTKLLKVLDSILGTYKNGEVKEKTVTLSEIFSSSQVPFEQIEAHLRLGDTKQDELIGFLQSSGTFSAFTSFLKSARLETMPRLSSLRFQLSKIKEQRDVIVATFIKNNITLQKKEEVAKQLQEEDLDKIVELFPFEEKELKILQKEFAEIAKIQTIKIVSFKFKEGVFGTEQKVSSYPKSVNLLQRILEKQGFCETSSMETESDSSAHSSFEESFFEKAMQGRRSQED